VSAIKVLNEFKQSAILRLPDNSFQSFATQNPILFFKYSELGFRKYNLNSLLRNHRFVVNFQRFRSKQLMLANEQFYT
jgi:hypothetical protein